MDIQSLLNNKRPLYESDSPPTKRQKIDEEVFSDETLEEDDNSLSPDNMKFTDPSVIAAGLENDQEVDLTGIEKLMLNEERLTRSAIHWNRLWDALKHNITLKKLYTGYCYGHESVNPIEDSHCLQLGEALKQNTALEELELDFHNFTSVGVVYIAEGLKFNKNLHSLVLGTNDLDFKALKALGEALKANNTLKKLDLSQLGDIKGDLVDFLVFCEALKTNTTLQHLSLHECVVAKEANDILQEALKFNQGLEVIQPEVHAPPRPRKKKKKIDQDEASAADEAGVKASNTNSMADGAKSGAEDLQSPFSGRSARRAKLTARASIAPLMAKKTRKKRKNNDTVNNEVKITESEAKNSSNEVKNEDPTAKAQNDVNNDEVKEPITKKARNTKKAVNKLENTVKTFGLRRKQRKAKLFAQSMIKPLMIRKTRKRKKSVEAGDEEERSKSENIDNKSEASPSRLQRRAKLLAEANITPLVLKKTRKRRKTLEEENNNNKRTYTRKNNGIKEEKLLKPRKYVRKQEVKSEDKGANTNVLNNNTNNNIEIKVPENQRKAKYFARANITPLMIRKTRKRRKDAKKEKEEGQSAENNTNNKERKAKLLARKSITPLVFKKTRKRRKNSEGNTEPNSPIKEKSEVKVPRAIGRPPKKREFKGESTSGSIPDTKSKPVVAFKPRRQRHKFIITYQAKSKELPRRRAKKEY